MFVRPCTGREHRSVRPRHATADSVVLFDVRNAERLITCLDRARVQNGGQYPPITAGEHLSGPDSASRGHVY